MLLVRTGDSTQSVHGREAPPCDSCVKPTRKLTAGLPFPGPEIQLL